MLVAGHQVLEHTWLQFLSRGQHFVSQLLFYGLIGPALTWWALTYLQQSVRRTEEAHTALAQAHERLTQTNQRLELLMRVNRRLTQAEDEDRLVKAILELPQDVAPVLGASLIPFDDQHHPLPAVYQGDVDPSVVEEWTNRMAQPEVRNACVKCVPHRASDSEQCALLAAAQETLALPGGISIQVFCFSLRRGDREYGLLNVYTRKDQELAPHEREVLGAMADEMALALESHRLRSRELAALYRLRQSREATNLHATLHSVLQDTVQALELDGGLVYLVEPRGKLILAIQVGPEIGDRAKVLQGLVAGALASAEPLLLGDLHYGAGDEPWSVLVAPLLSDTALVGGLVWWARHRDAFSPRHTRLAVAVASQMAMLVDNHQLYQRVEHQAALAERVRLAREIHDGLAQTLGYLKLRTAQISGWLQEEEFVRAGDALEQVRALIASAYIDVREAIDGLRLQPGTGLISDWLFPLVEDFRSLSAIEIAPGAPPPVRLPPEVHVQLLRIVQEALGNVRKHSGASHVRLEWRLDPVWLVLSIIDNGIGFDPLDVPPLSRHGLLIMQERAELLDAGFQIVSRPGAGAQVIVRLPLRRVETVEVRDA